LRRSSWFLFFVPVLIWSTTFYAITFQLHSVTPEVFSVGLRFLVASTVIFAYSIAQKDWAVMSKVDHGYAFASGVAAYGLSYVLTYVSERSVPSGLVAIAFTLMVFLTPLFARLAYGHAVARKTWIGGSLGVLGVMLCFLPGVWAEGAEKIASWAVFAMLCAAIASAIAAVISMRLNERNVPVISYTAWAMLYGAIATFVYGFASGETFQLDQRASYWIAFAYLSLLGTVVTFLCYLVLLRREGSARTMYISVLSPIGALLVSLTLEGLRLTLAMSLGISFALLGAWFTLRGKSSANR
jgi:drug/metabolite transporter (DMT)-like permease